MYTHLFTIPQKSLHPQQKGILPVKCPNLVAGFAVQDVGVEGCNEIN